MKYGLIGRTLVHSYSKEIHEALGQYEYNLFSMEPSELEGFIGARDFGGLNVTIPYKKDVIPLCDQVSDLASEIGAVNTLYFADGKLCGHNTDYEGFLYAAKRAGIDFSGKRVLILGTGGTSLTARVAAGHQGASEVIIASRSQSDGDKLLTYEELDKVSDGIEIIVNTTPAGTYPNNLQGVIDLDRFPACEGVIDVIYNPFKTLLIQQAEGRGLKWSNGLPMLVAQATAAAGYFLGTPGAFEDKNEEIISAMEQKMRNIVLIGMPGCGKSTVAKALGKITGKTVVDMDDEIVRRAGISIPEIFARDGEAGFRNIESQVAADLGKEKAQIIATGGGAVLRAENVAALRQNGFVLLLKRPLDKLATKGRPLSRDVDALRKMEKERMPLYEAACDMMIDNSRYRSKKALEEMLRKALNL
ncbi:MAG: hypothetical protein IJV66_02035 [Firmicutes bacterium]|nr:hypothetical protein [Bacillota bacterium]